VHEPGDNGLDARRPQRTRTSDRTGNALDHIRIDRVAGAGRLLDGGTLRTAEAVPGNTRKNRDKIMPTPVSHLMVAVAGLVTVYSVAAMSGNAWAGDMSAVAYTPTELLQWHSGLTVSSDYCVKLERKSTLTVVGPEDSTALLVMHGAVGIRDVADDGLDYSLDSFDAPKGARKSARDPAGIQDGSARRAR
jgi:hypothetical protein